MRIILILFLTVSCVYGPKQEKKSPLNYLSGEHYEDSGPTVNGIPLGAKRKIKNTTLSGVLEDQDFGNRLKFFPINLVKDGKVLSTVTSMHDGSFSISENLNNGEYFLNVSHKNYHGEKLVVVKEYEVKDIVVKVKLKSEK